MRTRFTILVVFAMVLSVVPLGSVAADAPEPVSVVGDLAVDLPEGAALEAELDAFAARKGFEVVYEQYVDIVDLTDRVLGDEPPDVIITPGPFFFEVADELVNLSQFVKTKKLRKAFGTHLMDVATAEDGAVLGAPIKVNLKTLVWYRHAAFEAAGYTVPETFAQLVTLSNQMVADADEVTGLPAPWCNYIQSVNPTSGFDATGWVGTDWIEDLLLGAEGGDVYDQWVDHSVVIFADLRVEAAFERYWQMINEPYVYDRANMLNVDFSENAVPLDSGDCLMHRQGTFFRGFLEGSGANLADYSTFKFPSVNPEFGDAAMGGATYVAALHDRDEVGKLVKFMLSAEFGETALAASGGWLLVNKGFDRSFYPPNGLSRSWADIVRAATRADLFRFDGSDLMPPQVGAGTFWTGIVDLVAGTNTIPEVLIEIDASWPVP